MSEKNTTGFLREKQIIGKQENILLMQCTTASVELPVTWCGCAVKEDIRWLRKAPVLSNPLDKSRKTRTSPRGCEAELMEKI